MEIEMPFGYCDYTIESDYAHIYNLYVYPEYRRQGFARYLLLSAKRDLIRRGWHGEIQIVADPTENSINKEQLKAFYESLGFKVFEYYG